MIKLSPVFFLPLAPNLYLCPSCHTS